ncbi:LolA family protein [Geochorda subterranea]|uniref:Outer membrane lipoprotein-sorting protein n=1 Tax=Geochorda subterranea TaxID=3109564 RepID=A0ABZ1BPI2_9FIRM|nr:hypothetical protein [Limnochorda sp. LNt]WRP14311.1 hypothetical protein VLY81_12960 [Limnochorda sp. LNt]
MQPLRRLAGGRGGGLRRQSCRFAAPAVLVALMGLVACGLAPEAAAGTSAGAPPATAQAVLERVEAAARDRRDMSARLTIEAIDARGRRARSVLMAAFIREPALARIEIAEPSALRGQTYVLDGAARELRLYLPVTHQIVVQRLDEAPVAPVAPERLLRDMGDRQGAPALRLIGTEQAEGATLYVLEGPLPSSSIASGGDVSLTGLPLPSLGDTLADGGSVRIWVDGRSWVPVRFVVYDPRGGQRASLSLTAVRLDQGLRPEQLRRLPEDAEVVEG